MAANYSSCILKAFGECGPYLPKREVDLVKFHSLNDDITTDIASLRIKTTHQHFYGNNIQLEKGLIADRAKMTENAIKADCNICPKHRYSLGKYYRPPRLCIYPEHSKLNKSSSKKKAPLCSAPLKILARINFPRHASVGDGLCTTCRNVLEKLVADGESGSDVELDDPPFSESITELPDLNETIKSLSDSISPIKFQLRSPVEDITSHTAKKLKRKLNQCMEAAADYFCEVLALSQGSAIKKRFLQLASTPVIEKSIPAEIEHLVEPFKQATSQQAKLIILTLVPDHISKTETMQYFECSTYLQEKARLLRKVNGAGCPIPEKQPVHRQ